jgi:hypothetical protein
MAVGVGNDPTYFGLTVRPAAPSPVSNSIFLVSADVLETSNVLTPNQAGCLLPYTELLFLIAGVGLEPTLACKAPAYEAGE